MSLRRTLSSRPALWLWPLALLLAAAVVAGWAQPPPARPAPPVDEVAVIAHGGAQGHAPANTVTAFDLALEQGADVLEMDLQLTADSEVVVIHDGTVDRTTDGSGAVRELTVDEIRALDAGAGFTTADGTRPYAGQGVRVPTFREVLQRYPDTPIIAELKTDAGPAIVEPVIELVEQVGRTEDLTLASFDEDYLQPVRERLPAVATNMPESETTGFYARQLVGLHAWWRPPGEVFQVPPTHDVGLGPVSLSDLRVPTRGFVRAAERVGARVQVWTVNEPGAMHELLDAGVHGLITDVPDVARDVLAERAQARLAPRGPAWLQRYEADLSRSRSLQEEQGWLTPVLTGVSFLGDEEFYLLALPLLYWAVHQRLAVWLGAMMLLSAGVNGVGKLTLATPRPSFLVPDLGVAHESSFGLPSGHAQNGAAIWGLLAAWTPWRWAQAALVAAIAVIGWSRIHLGVHALIDVLVGWAIGGLLVLAVVVAGPRVRRWWRGLPAATAHLAAVTASLAMIAPAVLLSARMAGWAWAWPGLEADAATGASHVVTPAATLAGFLIGRRLLTDRGGFDHRGPWGRRALRVLVGLAVLVALWGGLDALLPDGESAAALTARYVRYGLVGAWVGGLAPLLFRRLGLAEAGASAPDARPPAGAARGAPTGADGARPT